MTKLLYNSDFSSFHPYCTISPDNEIHYNGPEYNKKVMVILEIIDELKPLPCRVKFFKNDVKKANRRMSKKRGNQTEIAINGFSFLIWLILKLLQVEPDMESLKNLKKMKTKQTSVRYPNEEIEKGKIIEKVLGFRFSDLAALGFHLGVIIEDIKSGKNRDEFINTLYDWYKTDMQNE